MCVRSCCCLCSVALTTNPLRHLCFSIFFLELLAFCLSVCLFIFGACHRLEAKLTDYLRWLALEARLLANMMLYKLWFIDWAANTGVMNDSRFARP